MITGKPISITFFTFVELSIATLEEKLVSVDPPIGKDLECVHDFGHSGVVWQPEHFSHFLGHEPYKG